MNYRAVAWLLGCVLLLLAAFLTAPAAVALAYAEPVGFQACLGAAFVATVPGAALWWFFRGSTTTARGGLDFFRREGLAVVGLSWLLAGIVGALPFLFAGVVDSPVDAFFESASGFTTTGSTILQAAEIDGLPRSIAFWRSFTHWLGGIGIVLVFVVLFPTGGRSLFRSEVPGVAREAVQQRVRDSAMSLVKIYVGLTILEILFLIPVMMRSETFIASFRESFGRAPRFGDMLFDAAIHSFGTLATGGFSSHSSSIGYYGSWAYEGIIVAFMFLAGINFGVYDLFLRLGPKQGWRNLLRSPEVGVYVGMIVGCTGILSLVLWFWGGSNGDPAQADLPDYSSIGQSLRDASFNVVSIQTSTGYGTADFDRWPHFGRMLLMFIAVVGACAGSTGGGMKVIRILIFFKAAVRGLRRFSRPRAIHPIYLGGHTLDEGTVGLVMGYCALWGTVFVGGTLFISALNVEPITAATAVLATLNNIGPGLAGVGPSSNFADMPEVGKAVLALFMIVGRLEFYAVVVLLAPRFWRH